MFVKRSPLLSGYVEMDTSVTAMDIVKTVYTYPEFGLSVLLVDKGRKISKHTYEQNNEQSWLNHTQTPPKKKKMRKIV